MDVEINYSLNYDFLNNILKMPFVSSALSIPLLLIFPGILFLYLYAEKKINYSVHRRPETKTSKRLSGDAETGWPGL